MTTRRFLALVAAIAVSATGCGTDSSPDNYQTAETLDREAAHESSSAGDESTPAANNASVRPQQPSLPAETNTDSSKDVANAVDEDVAVPSANAASSDEGVQSGIVPTSAVVEAATPNEARPAVSPSAAMNRADTNDTAADDTADASDTSPETAAKPVSYPPEYHEMPNWVVEGPERAIRVSYDDLDLLKLMNVDPVPEGIGPQLPKRITELDGQRIRLRGFMFPPYAEEGLKGFVFARDNEICCFGRSPKIYDIIPVELRDGVTTRYIEGRPFDVVGVMHVDPDIELFQLFYIDDAIVIQ